MTARRKRGALWCTLVAYLIALGAQSGCGRIGFRDRQHTNPTLRDGSDASTAIASDAAMADLDAGMARDAALDASTPIAITDGGQLDGALPIMLGDAGGLDGSMAMADAGDAAVDAGPVGPPTPAPAPTRGNYSSLIHRYSFNGPSTACVYDNPQLTITTSECARDSVGTAHGIIHNATMHDGVVEFTAAGWVAGSSQPPPNPDYVSLPSPLVSPLHDMTIIVWFYWSGFNSGSNHSPRVFNFGSDNGNNGLITYLYLTPSSDASNTPLMAFSAPSHWDIDSTAPARPSGSYCYGIVFDNSRTQVNLYVGGYSNVTNDLSGNWLADLDDQKNWLGRSPVAMDTPFVGTIDEFRIYNAALGQTDIQNICGNPN